MYSFSCILITLYVIICWKFYALLFVINKKIRCSVIAYGTSARRENPGYHAVVSCKESAIYDTQILALDLD